MAALVGGNGGSGNGTPVVDVFTQVHRLGGGVIVVCELTGNGDDFHVPDTVRLQHAGGNFCSRKAGGNF